MIHGSAGDGDRGASLGQALSDDTADTTPSSRYDGDLPC